MTWWDDQQPPPGKPPTVPLDPNAPPDWMPPEWAGQPIRHTQGVPAPPLPGGTTFTPVPGAPPLTPAPGFGFGGQYYPPGSSEPVPVASGKPPTAPASTGGASSGPPNPSDRNSVKQWVIAEATKLGRMDIANNPDYWVDQAMAHTKPDGSIDTGYWSDRMSTANQGGSGGAGGVSTGFGLGGGAYGGPGGFGGLTAPFTGQFQSPGDFSPPDLNNTTDPGYAARLQMGIDAIQKSAAAKGTLLTGGTLKDLTQFGQDFASNEYDKVFNRALTTNETAYNRKLGEFGLGYNIFRNNQNDAFSKLYGVTGLGLNAANSANNDLGAYGAGLGGAAGQFGNLSSLYGGLGSAYATNAGNVGLGVGNSTAAGQLSLGQIYSSLGLSLGNTGGNLAGDIQAWWDKTHGGGSSSGGSSSSFGA
jgi:hypothetical protein